MSFDLQDGYHCVAVHKDHRQYFTICIDGQAYQFTVLPFGWSLSPWYFTKVMRVLVRKLRSSGLRVLPYLDDFLIMLGPSLSQALQIRTWVGQILDDLGLVRNAKKGVWEPTSRLQHLGLIIDFSKGLFLVPPAKCQLIVASAKAMLSRASRHRRWLPARLVAEFTGLAIAVHLAVPPARLFLRALYNDLATRTDWGRDVQLSHQSMRDLAWWTSLHRSAGNCFWPIQPTISLHTDASDGGWGAVLQQDSPSAVLTHGFWSANQTVASNQSTRVKSRSLLGAKLASAFTSSANTPVYRQSGGFSHNRKLVFSFSRLDGPVAAALLGTQTPAIQHRSDHLAPVIRQCASGSAVATSRHNGLDGFTGDLRAPGQVVGTTHSRRILFGSLRSPFTFLDSFSSTTRRRGGCITPNMGRRASLAVSTHQSTLSSTSQTVVPPHQRLSSRSDLAVGAVVATTTKLGNRQLPFGSTRPASMPVFSAASGRISTQPRMAVVRVQNLTTALLSATLPKIPPHLQQTVQTLFHSSLAASTWQQYAQQFADFSSFCNSVGVLPIPATSVTVAAYIASMFGRSLSVSSMQQRLAAINRLHRDLNLVPPASGHLIDTLRTGYAAQTVATIGRPINRAPLPAQLVVRIVCLIPDLIRRRAWVDTRNCLAVALAFVLFLRASSVAHVTVDQLVFRDDSVYFREDIRKGHRSDAARALPLPCLPDTRWPSLHSLLHQFVRLAPRRSSYVFILTSDPPAAGTLAPSTLLSSWLDAALLLIHVSAPPGSTYSSHSMRAGAATSALAIGVSLPVLMSAGGWASIDSARRYIDAAAPPSEEARYLLGKLLR